MEAEEGIQLDVIESQTYPIQGDIVYHDLKVIGKLARRIGEGSELELELLKNPNSNYRRTGENVHLICVGIVNEPYESVIIARGGREMIQTYETICDLTQGGEYVLHLFSNSEMQLSESKF